MRIKRLVVFAIVLPVVVVLGAWIYKSISPFQICLRHAQAEGIKSGMTAESAASYADGLCRSKSPLRN